MNKEQISDFDQESNFDFNQDNNVNLESESYFKLF